jgi:hypothetical protein
MARGNERFLSFPTECEPHDEAQFAPWAKMPFHAAMNALLFVDLQSYFPHFRNNSQQFVCILRLQKALFLLRQRKKAPPL